MLPNEDYYENRKKLTTAIDKIVAACGSNQGIDEAIEAFKADFPSGTTERMIFTVGELAGHRRGMKDEKILTPLKAHQGSRSLQGNDPAPNGIACPECGNELMDADPTTVLLSLPPQLRTRCSSCNYRGLRYA